MCIVLSGTGSDGTIGVTAIKEHGGLAMAQSEYDHVAMSGMPESAAATGLVDFVLHVEDMPAKLVQYYRHLTEVAGQKNDDGLRLDATDHLSTVTGLLRARLGHDFSRYKTKTIVRRIQRRMQVLEIDTMSAFIERLRRDPAQLDLLFADMLIGVTQFFRDPGAYEALQSIGMPLVMKDKGDAELIRIWVPGCSTGEEVYSIAILLREALDRAGIAPKVQIFGTDIDETAVATARAGRYPKTMVGLSPERIERWFADDKDGCCVIKQIREMCVFSIHSLVKDPPFSKLDLISCRNVLIYLNGEVQEIVIRAFHYALRPDGVLLLGPSEGVTRNAGQFDTIDAKHRIYRRRETRTPVRLPQYPPEGVRSPQGPATSRNAAAGEDRIARSIRLALERHSPVHVLINEQLEILRFSGGETGRYLEPGDGVASLNLFAILRKSLRPTVRAAVQKVFASKQAVVQENVPIEIDGEPHRVTVIVEPIAEATETLCVVAFRDLGQLDRRGSDEGDAMTEHATLQALEADLLATRARLQAALDSEEAATQEAKSSAEEFQSVNEELQSSNEELETAKEEMQSINEELQTINAELSSKNEQLTSLNNDMQNLLESTQIATIFLDNELRIKGFTPAMKDLFHLREADRSRPLTDIVNRLAYNNLGQDVSDVLRMRTAIEREVQITTSGIAYIMRIMPYNTLAHVVDGVVITFVDITGRRKMEETLREHAALVEFSGDALIGVTLDGTIRSWNPTSERLFGYPACDMIGRSITLLAGPDQQDQQNLLVAQARSGMPVGPIDTIWRHQNAANVEIELTIVPILDADGNTTAMAVTTKDISEWTQTEIHRDLLLHELSHRVKNALATVQSMAVQTLRNASILDGFKDVFLARLMALSGTHDLLTQGKWHVTNLRDVLEAELRPYLCDGHNPWNIRGPDIQIDAKMALALGMAFHELATNAVKYGALSVPEGRLDIRWENRLIEATNRLQISWVEMGGPAVAKPTKRGFGSRLIVDGLAYELDGIVQVEYEPAGLRCMIEAPLRSPETPL